MLANALLDPFGDLLTDRDLKNLQSLQMLFDQILQGPRHLLQTAKVCCDQLGALLCIGLGRQRLEASIKRFKEGIKVDLFQ